ncbi:MAG: sigma-70 family RNA polymerase sigma factor [Gemmataceae bacterium]
MSLQTTHLPELLAQLRQGNRAAAETIFRQCQERLVRMAAAMLRRFPTVAAREQPGDVVQEASLSLLAALHTLDPTDTRAFYNLAAEHVRRRLLDLARKHRPRELPAPPDPDDDLDLWADLHEAVRLLPEPIREVFCLRFYQGHSLAEIARFLEMSEATARRRWLEAVADLSRRLREWPRFS